MVSSGPHNRWPLLVLLGVLGVTLSTKVIPGPFTIDDVNYLVNVVALRDGRVTITNTETLPPSRELLFFDPTPGSQVVLSTPVASTAPPLYAPLAIPFSIFGWRGLVALNTLSYLVTIFIVFAYVARYAAEPSTAWLAAAAFGLGGYALEYALGLWPQGLSLALCTGGVVAAGRVIDGGSPRVGLLAGLLLGFAAGVRYQNAAILSVVALAVVLLSPRRWRTLAMYTLGAALPLVLSSSINYIRLDSWNPISKGPGYLEIPMAGGPAASWFDPLRMIWAMVVDYSARPRLPAAEAAGWLTHDPTTGAFLVFNATQKKAFIQSAPWAALGLLWLAAVWTPWIRLSDATRRQARLLSLVAAALIGVFALAGPRRHDGLGFNQRYLLEILPLAAVGFAWALDGLRLKRREIGVGLIAGSALVLTILLATPLEGGPNLTAWLARQFAILKLPLVLGVALVILWVFAKSTQRAHAAVGVAAGLALGWGLMLHVADDVFSAQRLRADNLSRTERLGEVLQDGTALVVYRASMLVVAPLLLSRDIVVLDAAIDAAADAPRMIRDLLGRGRRVFLVDAGFSPDAWARTVSGLVVTPVGGGAVGLVEVHAEERVPAPATSSAPR